MYPQERWMLTLMMCSPTEWTTGIIKCDEDIPEGWLRYCRHLTAFTFTSENDGTDAGV